MRDRLNRSRQVSDWVRDVKVCIPVILAVQLQPTKFSYRMIQNNVNHNLFCASILYFLRLNSFVSVMITIVIKAVSGFHGNELSSFNALHELKLRSRSRTKDQSYVSVYRICSLNIDNISIWICEFYCIVAYLLHARTVEP
jgi:hypothetical protein